MTDFPREPRLFLARSSSNSWALALATALLVLIIAGVLPRLPW